MADAFGLGRAESLGEPVARGEVGEVRRLVTDQGAWAIKQSFDPFDDAELAEAERSGAFHLACWQAGVPTPEPRTAGGRFVVQVGGEPLQAYGWVDDLADPDTGLDPTEVGRLVAAMHAVRLPPEGGSHDWFEAAIGQREWRAVLKASRAAGAPYADRLAEVLPGLLEVETILTPMRRLQPCHLDLWSDNLRRTRDGALCVIDFGNAAPADPARELAMVVFEFGGGDGVRQLRLYDAYRAAGGPGRVVGREDFGLTVAQLHHIGHRHLRMWLGARDSEGRARSLAGIEEFLGTPFLLADVDAALGALA